MSKLIDRINSAFAEISGFDDSGFELVDSTFIGSDDELIKAVYNNTVNQLSVQDQTRLAEMLESVLVELEETSF